MSTITEKILGLLQMQAESAVDLFDIFTARRPLLQGKARYSMFSGPVKFKTDWADWYRRRQAFHSMLNKLKREGFVVQKEKRRNAPWSITQSGARWLVRIKKKGGKRLMLPPPKYQKRGRSGLVIIAFDVPEREREKRRWLRVALISLGFQKLQQSVWAGNIRIPAEFIEDMKENAILSYVHIFSVTRSGTLEKVV